MCESVATLIMRTSLKDKFQFNGSYLVYYTADDANECHNNHTDNL